MTLETPRPVLQTIGSYDLLEKIAEGGMGAIYKGRHLQTGQVVAIKVMPPHAANNPLLLKRFEQEFRAASMLDHPNIVRAIDYGDDGQSPFLVMEFVEGESLGQKLERDGAMPEAEAIRLIAQVAQGLHRAHKQGLIHRDVKPDNILVTPDGQAKLADLGLVKEMETDLNLTRTGRGLGTPHFMAPEQFRNAKNADVRCDIYSLGATLYNMVTGELPFRSNGLLDAWLKKVNNDLVPAKKLIPGLSERVDWAIRRAMSPKEEHRPASCREFIEDLTGHSTRRLPAVKEPQLGDLWYLVYTDDEGQTHTVKGTTTAIRHSFKEGYLGDAANIRAGRSKAGPFEPLRGYPEFRDLVIDLSSVAADAPLWTTPAPSRRSSASQVPPTGSRQSAATTSKNRATVKQLAEEAPPEAPLIQLEPGANPKSGPSLEWLKWLVIIVLVLAGAGFVFWLLQ
jgi:eukaryotic-like serine/threonine-protein kinase